MNAVLCGERMHRVRSTVGKVKHVDGTVRMVRAAVSQQWITPLSDHLLQYAIFK